MPEHEAGLSGLDLSELKSNRELKEHALKLFDLFFSEPTISRITIRNIADWPDLFPELSKKCTSLKHHNLEFVSFVRYDTEDVSQQNGIATEEDDDESSSWEETEEEEEDPVLRIEMSFLPQTVDDEEALYEATASEVNLCLYEKDKYAQLWTSLEEKTNIFFERVTDSRQGVAARLKIISELLSYGIDRAS